MKRRARSDWGLVKSLNERIGAREEERVRIDEYIRSFSIGKIERITDEEICRAQARLRDRLKLAIKETAETVGRMLYLENCEFCVEGKCTLRDFGPKVRLSGAQAGFLKKIKSKQADTKLSETRSSRKSRMKSFGESRR